MRKSFKTIGFILIFALLVPITSYSKPAASTMAAVTNEVNTSLIAANTDTVKLSKTSAILSVGKTTKLELSGTTKTITWKSSNTKIATVKDGTVKGIAVGTAKITATVGTTSYTCNVTVMNPTKKQAEIIESDAIFGGEKDIEVKYRTWVADKLLLLDLKPAQKSFTAYGFKNTGIYAAFYSKTTITVEGIDAKGKSVGIITKKGNFYKEFPGAVELLITNSKEDLFIYFYPVAPKIITKADTYSYDDFTWHKLKGGNIRCYYLLQLKNCSYNMSGYPAIFNVYNWAGDIFNTYLEKTYPGLSDYWHGGYLSSLNKESSALLQEFKLIVSQTTIYLDNDKMMLYGKNGLNFDDEFISELESVVEMVKKAGKNYIKDTKVFDLKLRISYYDTNASALYPLVYLNDRFTNFTDSLVYDISEIYEIYCYELIHFYDTKDYPYRNRISTWSVGTAEACAEDSMKLLKLVNENYLHKDYDFATYKNGEYINFEKYFLAEEGLDCFAVGYYFIRYLQKNYGMSIVSKINKALDKAIDALKYDSENAEADAIFLQCIKDCTKTSVFTDFEKDVVLR